MSPRVLGAFDVSFQLVCDLLEFCRAIHTTSQHQVHITQTVGFECVLLYEVLNLFPVSLLKSKTREVIYCSFYELKGSVRA